MVDIQNPSNSSLKAPRSSRKVLGTISTPIKEKKPTEVKSERLVEIIDGRVVMILPIRTVSEGNCFEPWQKKHKRHKSQKRLVALALGPVKCQIKIPCHLKLTRYAPRSLDKHDNLPISFKYLLDACCEEITGDYRPGHADNDERITISYDQEKSKTYSVKIEIIPTL